MAVYHATPLQTPYRTLFLLRRSIVAEKLRSGEHRDTGGDRTEIASPVVTEGAPTPKKPLAVSLNGAWGPWKQGLGEGLAEKVGRKGWHRVG